MAYDQRITAIEPQERRKNRRSIFLDGNFVLGVDETIIADLGLRVGQQISEEELNRIVRAELVNKAKERALTLLEYRKRSRSEIMQRLKKAGYEQDIIDDVLVRLDAMGFVDDADFSQSWVNHRLAGKAMGRKRIRYELKLKGVEDSVVEEALSTVDADEEYNTALESARRRWQRDNDPDERSKKRRLASYLGRQGFEWDIIKRILSELSAEEEPDFN
ncbi:MAG: regulatory protein RecX [Armatimonadota bacterium]